MLFNSYEFVFVFLPACLIGCLIAERLSSTASRWFLVAMSLGFYAWWSTAYVWVLVASVVLNYSAASLIARVQSRLVLGLVIAANLAALGYFKYLSFFSGVASSLSGVDLFVSGIVLPIGISFFTFQQIAYHVDRWRAQVPPHGFLDYAMLSAFFPHLLAGPIVRHSEFLPQLRRPLPIRAHYVLVGLTLFAVGLVKKVVLADSLETLATPVFDAARAGGVPAFEAAWRGALAYAFQLYFDFSGYSDMAIGLALMFGFRFPINFDAPYRSTSIAEFWRRWHMTLGRFLRDYLYIPLGGGRRGRGLTAVNLFVVMLLGGLWHGAAWTFILWGALHGAMLAVHHAWSRLVPVSSPPTAVRRGLAWSATFLGVTVAWVAFRADSVGAALRVWTGMLPGSGHTPAGPDVAVSSAWALIATGLAVVLLLPTSHAWLGRYIRFGVPSDRRASSALPRQLAWRLTPAWAATSAALLAAAILGLAQGTTFLYYQF